MNKTYFVSYAHEKGFGNLFSDYEIIGKNYKLGKEDFKKWEKWIEENEGIKQVVILNVIEIRIE